MENFNITNVLGAYLKTYLDFNLAKIVARQVQIVFYQRPFDDMTMGNYKILQEKLSEMGKNINELKTKYFEVKAPPTITSIECSECGANLKISSKEENFVICDHCNTSFLIKWQK